MTENVVRLAPPRPTGPSSRSTIARAAAGKDRPDRAYEVRADNPQGLLLRVQPSGLRTFYVQVGRGQRVRIGPAGTYTVEQARERARKILLDPDAAKTTHGGFTLAEYIEQHYNEHAVARLKNGAASVARVKAAWKPLLNKRMADIRATDVDRLRTKRLAGGTAASTVNRDTAALSGLFAHWATNTKGAQHPLSKLVKIEEADDERIRYLSQAESMRLRKALAARDANAAQERANANKWRVQRGYEVLPDITGYSDHITPMTLLTLNAGLRRGEMFSLTWEHVDLRLATITVLASNSKGNNTRTIPLNAEALDVLQTIRPEPATGLVFRSPVTGKRFDNIKKAWAEVIEAAELPDLRWHDLRHDFASQLVMRGCPLYTVQRLLGHSTPKMTMRYARLAPQQLADAVSLLVTP